MKKPKIQEPKLAQNAREIVRKRYLRTDMKGKILETPGEMLWRVAYHMAKAEVVWGSNGIVMEMAHRFYERMIDFRLVCAGKAMFEAGNPGGTGQLSSCFVLPIEDSIDTIFKTLGEAAVIHKNNGGTGFNFSSIRPRGDRVRNVPNASSGPVDFIKAYSAALAQILQGAKRQGANIGILNVDHPDIESFITLKEDDGYLKNFNISVGITDEFMRFVEENKMWGLVNPRTKKVVKRVKARKLFAMIARQAWKTGDPGIAFLDTLERGNTVPNYGKLEATNPCIVGDALISTADGLVRFEELYERYGDKGVVSVVVDNRVVGGSGVSKVNTIQVLRREKKAVYKMLTRHGFFVKATKDHKIMTIGGWRDLGKLKKGEVVLLQSGEGGFSRDFSFQFHWENKIRGKNGRKYEYNLPLKWSENLGVFMGWLIGDGFVRIKRDKRRREKGYVILSFGMGNDEGYEFLKGLLDKWKIVYRQTEPTNRTRQVVCNSKFVAQYFVNLGVLMLPSMKKRVPSSIFTAPRKVLVGFLRGLFSSDGTIGYVESKSSYVRLTSKSRELLQDVQILLLQIGIYSKIYDRSRKPRKSIFPEYITASGETKRYDSDGVLYELEISKDSVLIFLKEVGFLLDMHRDKISKLKDKNYYGAKFQDMVVSVDYVGEENVYDLVEPRTNSFIANGVVVHNCGEIALFPYESCNLTSIDLARHMRQVAGEWRVDWKELKKTVRLGVRFLDNMIEVNYYPLPEVEQAVRNGNRRIGLGVMGFAHLLYRLGVPYNCQKAVRLASKLAKFIYETAFEMSEELAEMRGSFANWELSIYPAKGQPMRNCAVTMVAPTGTISILANTSSGIEPVFSLVTTRRSFYEDDKANKSTKSLVMVDPIFKEYLRERYKKKVDRDRILEDVARGSAESLDAQARRVFVTTHEIDASWHIKVQAAWQKYFDNSISKTINFPESASVEDVKKAYLLAWKLGCKGITIYRDGSREDQVLSVGNSKEGAGQELCPECGGGLQRLEGCSKCYDCGWSKCG